MNKKVFNLLLGVASFALMFGVTAERTLVLLPVALTGLHVAFGSRTAQLDFEFVDGIGTGSNCIGCGVIYRSG